VGASAGRLVLGVAGAAIGGFVGGPTGAQVGWGVGLGVANAVFPAPAQRVQGPRLSDLKVTGVEYGQPIPYLQGMMRVPGQVWWSSTRQEIAHTTTTEEGGKGGGQEVERTDYTYEVNMLFGLTSNEIAGVTRIWLNGKLIWTNLSAEYAVSLAALAGVSLTEDEANAALTASGNTSAWRRITVYTGASNQMPDPTYEASVGTENAIAYRGRGSVFIEGLQLGSSGVIPNLTFEVVTRALSGEVDADVLLQSAFANNDPADISSYSSTVTETSESPTTTYAPEYINNELKIRASTGQRLVYTNAQMGIQTGRGVCFEFFARLQSVVSGYAFAPWRVHKNVDQNSFIAMHVHHTTRIISFQIHQSGAVQSTGVTLPAADTHIAIQCDDDSDIGADIRFYVAGNLVLTTTGTEVFNDSTWSVIFGTMGTAPQTIDEDLRFSELRVKRGTIYTGSSFTPPTSFPDPDSGSTQLTPLPEDLADVVSSLSLRSGLTASQIDVTSLQGSPQTTVRGMAITQITSTRSVIEMLMQAYFFEAHVRDKIYFVFRGGSSVETIDFDDMGATESEDPETFQLIQGNDIEFPAQVSVTYANWLDDYQNDTQESDRLVSAAERSVSAVQLPLALIPSEAKTIANKLVLDQYVSLVSSTVRLLGEYGNVEPTDIITPTDKDGNTYRMRVVDVLDNYPVFDLSVVMDNATILTHTATTSSDYEPTLVVEEPPTTLIELMDIPILRDVDDDPGFYAAMKGSNQDNWPGGSLFQSLVSDTDYSEIKVFQDSAVFGTATTTLDDWNSGRLFDMQSTVTVSVGGGTLSSSTRSAVLNDSSVNAMLIGSEVIQFITATLISTGFYTLSGLLRGCAGTEWAMTGHSSSERCVLLRLSGLRRISMQSNELGQNRYYAGVTIGRSLSSGLTGSPAEGELFVNTGRGLAPYNPVYLRYERETNGDITITGQKRSRLAVRMIGSLGINVPDDDTTSWLLDILSNEGSPQTVYRTLTGSVSGTEITWTYSASDQATDFGSPTVSQLSVGAYGYSSTVGRGRGKFKTGAV
jgi:hypothetical protein